LFIDKKQMLRKAATEVCVSYETLRTWVEASGRKAAVQETRSGQQRIKELERENRSLRMECDILKEAVGIFSQRPK
jgi:transposase-like protein